MPVEKDGAAFAEAQSGNEVKACRLASTVRPENSDNFTGMDLKRDIPDNPLLANGYGKIVCKQAVL